MSRAMVAASLLVSAFAWAADKPPAPDEKTKALIEGQLPDDPARPLVQGKCMLCHTGEYLTQQRLTAGQWQKTVEKMRKFGTPASDEEAKVMTDYLARYWTPDLPAFRAVRAPPPRGSVPGK
jgi:Spy/CpxP family protein refolding chaperone